MDDILEAKFEQIMVDALVRAEKLNPDISEVDFYSGLKVMQKKFVDRLDQARSDAGLDLEHAGFTF